MFSLFFWSLVASNTENLDQTKIIFGWQENLKLRKMVFLFYFLKTLFVFLLLLLDLYNPTSFS